MKLSSITLNNVKSFGEKTSLEFNEGINILIGPNGGGKSNFLDTLVVVLSKYFIKGWNTDVIQVSGIPRDRIISEDYFQVVNQFLDKNVEMQDKGQEIEITLTVTDEDVFNYKLLLDNYELLSQIEAEQFVQSNFIGRLRLEKEGLKTSEKLSYKIVNGALSQEMSSEAKKFLDYLNNYQLAYHLINKYNSDSGDAEKIKPLLPIFQYFSPHRNSAIESVVVNLPGMNLEHLSNMYRNSTSRSSTKTSDYIGTFLSAKKREYDDNEQSFNKDPQIRALIKALSSFGFEKIDAECTDKRKNTYKIVLFRNSESIDITKLSSGERELITLILTIFAYHVKNGILIIDEPELHIHPSWQKKMSEVFSIIESNETSQMLIVTHSPTLLNYSNIDDVIRVYKKDGFSAFVKPDIGFTNERKKEWFQVINTLNLEKIFFADKIVLVEGISDRIIFKSIIDKIRETEPDDHNTSIEVIDVGGKINFERFNEFLTEFQIEVYTISDIDYLVDLGLLKKQCLELNYSAKYAKLVKKGSLDGASLVKILDKFTFENHENLEEKDYKTLEGLNAYLNKRSTKIKTECKEELYNLIESKYGEKLYVLKEGELEDYFEDIPGKINTEKALEISKKIISGSEIPEELETICKMIITD